MKFKILFLSVLSVIFAHAVHIGAGYPAYLSIRDSSGTAIVTLSNVGTVSAAGALASTYTPPVLGSGIYSATLYWQDSTGTIRSDFSNGTITATFSVGGLPTPILTVTTKDALDSSRSRAGVPYLRVVLTEDYGSATTTYSAADRYDANPVYVEVLPVSGATEAAIRATQSLVVNDASFTNITTSATGSPIDIWNSSNILPLPSATADSTFDRFYLMANGVRYAQRDVSIYASPTVTPPANFPSGTVYFDPATTTFTFNVSSVYPNSWVYLQITTPAGEKYFYKSGVQSAISTAAAADYLSAAPAGNPSVITGNSTTAGRTLAISINMGHLATSLGAAKLPDGDFSFSLFERSPNAITTAGGFGTDLIWSAANQFTYQNIVTVNTAIVTP